MPSNEETECSCFAPRASHLNDLWGALVIEELRRSGVDVCCISPGSRSTPLALAAANNPGVRTIVHFDERGTAYHALGLAKALQRPVALICTSGTAAANYFPAVVEASMQRVPLILLTADRPPELLDAGANQAIDQTKLYGDYVRWQTVLPCPDAAIAPEVVLTTVDQGVYRAVRSPRGPVHINCMFREPLAPTTAEYDVDAYLAAVTAWRTSRDPYTQYVVPRFAPEPARLEPLIADIDEAAEGILLVGRLASVAERDAVASLAQVLGWPVFADITSGLRLGHPEAPFVAYYDQLLLSARGREMCRPQAVLHLGGAFTSKRLLQHFEAHPPETYVMVADHPFRHDPAHRVRCRMEADIPAFCESLMRGLTHVRRASPIDHLREGARRVHDVVDAMLLQDDQLSEIAVARLVSQSIPPESVLFLGNSMPIRDMDMYASPEGAGVWVEANRGASGIDGAIATAAGHARARGESVTAIVGDLALLHDLNSLALAGATPIVIVVINNNGGGIFSFLPVAEASDHFERVFAAPHGLSFSSAADLFGLQYCNPKTTASFVDAYAEALRSGLPSLIEINTDREENVRLHQRLQSQIASALETAHEF